MSRPGFVDSRIYWQTVALVLLPFMVQCAQRYLSRVSAEICEALFIGAGVKDGLLFE
jgi:hypothetical protein